LDGHITSTCRLKEFHLSPASTSFLLGLLLHTEDGGSKFLQNVTLSLNYTAVQCRRLYSS
jgi:hypothetical protein